MSKYYIARDKRGALYCYKERPTKGEDSWQPVDFEPDSYCELDETFFQKIKWEDKEPKVLTIEESPWVKVEDRLPADNEKAVVLYKYAVTNKYIHIINKWHNGKWIDRHTNLLIPIAWMPIPEFEE